MVCWDESIEAFRDLGFAIPMDVPSSSVNIPLGTRMVLPSDPLLRGLGMPYPGPEPGEKVSPKRGCCWLGVIGLFAKLCIDLDALSFELIVLLGAVFEDWSCALDWVEAACFGFRGDERLALVRVFRCPTCGCSTLLTADSLLIVVCGLGEVGVLGAGSVREIGLYGILDTASDGRSNIATLSLTDDNFAAFEGGDKADPAFGVLLPEYCPPL